MPKTTTTLKDAAQQYMNHLEQSGKNPRTLYTYSKDLQQVQAFFGGERELLSINTLQVGKFLKSEALLKLPDGRERADQTIRKTVRVFRMFLFWCVEQGYMNEAPVPKSIPLGRNAGVEQEPKGAST